MQNILDLLNITVKQFPDKTAIICEGENVSFRTLGELVENVAQQIREHWKICAGDKIAILLPNCAEFIFVYLGIIRTGAIALPINIRLKPQEIAFILEDANVTALVAHHKTWETVQQVMANFPELRQIMSVGFESELTTSIKKFLTGCESKRKMPELGPADVAAIIYTSGTTGLPKGAMIMHKNIIFNARCTIEGFDFEHEDRHLITVPLFHVTGLNTILITSLMLGSTVIVSDKTAPRDVMTLIDQHHVTTYFGVPTTYVLLIDLGNIISADLSSVRIFVYSGAPMPPDTILKLDSLFPHIDLVNLYGLTETTSVTTVLPAAEASGRGASVGRPVPNIQLKIIDSGGMELPKGEIGELCVKGDSVFKGYYGNPGATEAAIINGWFRTGDNAIINEEGYIFLKSRKNELIIVGGENVYPIEVENVICSLSEVLESAVIGLDHPVMGQTVKAVVVLERNAQLSEDEIKLHCSQRLASYKAPQAIEFREHLPRNPSGKVVKRFLS